MSDYALTRSVVAVIKERLMQDYGSMQAVADAAGVDRSTIHRMLDPMSERWTSFRLIDDVVARATGKESQSIFVRTAAQGGSD